MAKPATENGTQLLIKVETSAGSGVFTHDCLINTDRGIQFSSDTNTILVPDCDNPDDPAWMERIKDGLSATITGAGVLDKASVAKYDEWMRDSASKNVRVYIGTHGYWAGAFHLTGWEVTGSRNEKQQVSITLESDGEVAAYVVA